MTEMRELLKATKLVIVTHEARMLLVQAEDLLAKNTFLGKKYIYIWRISCSA